MKIKVSLEVIEKDSVKRKNNNFYGSLNDDEASSVSLANLTISYKIRNMAILKPLPYYKRTYS